MQHPSLQYVLIRGNVWNPIFRYLYGDLYAGAIWAADENPDNSGTFNSSKIPFSCSADSPIECGTVPGSTLPNLGYVFSFGEDNNKDVFILANNGVHRVVRPSRCKYSCSKENLTDSSASPSPASPHGSYASRLSDSYCSILVLLVSSLLMLWLGVF